VQLAATFAGVPLYRACGYAEIEYVAAGAVNGVPVPLVLMGKALPGPWRVEGEPSQSEFAFHEDDWSQVEFFSNGQLATVHRMLEAYKPFEAAIASTLAGANFTYVRSIGRR
jgi:hypothetical protein